MDPTKQCLSCTEEERCLGCSLGNTLLSRTGQGDASIKLRTQRLCVWLML